MLISKLIKNDKVIPVVMINNETEAAGLTNALLNGGISVIEVTLRNSYGVQALSYIKQTFPEMTVLAGTVTCVESMDNVMCADVDGIVMPGITRPMLEYAQQHSIPILPGVTSPSEIMLAMEFGFSEYKLFPAAVVGGISMLKALSGPFPTAKFCPTGGVSEKNVLDYLALNNVICVGGTWVAPQQLIKTQAWGQITELCIKAISLLCK